LRVAHALRSTQTCPAESRGGGAIRPRKKQKLPCTSSANRYTFQTSTFVSWLCGFVVRKKVMLSIVSAELDLIEELKLRRWAREHYVPHGQRQLSWHPVVHEEMGRKDLEMTEPDSVPQYAWSKS